MLNHCHGCSDRLIRWTFTFYLVANTISHIRMTSVYLASTRANRIKNKIEPSFTQRVKGTLACPKTAIQSRTDNG